jgi:hypothetical protein
MLSCTYRYLYQRKSVSLCLMYEYELLFCVPMKAPPPPNKLHPWEWLKKGESLKWAPRQISILFLLSVIKEDFLQLDTISLQSCICRNEH